MSKGRKTPTQQQQQKVILLVYHVWAQICRLFWLTIFSYGIKILVQFRFSNQISGQLSEYCTHIDFQWLSVLHKNIRIFNDCEVQIEYSVTRVTVWHHKASFVTPNSYLVWRNFQYTPNNRYGFFFLHALLKLEKVTPVAWIFVSQRRWCRSVWWKMTSVLTAKRQKDILTSCTRVVIHTPCKTTISGTNHSENPVRYARKFFFFKKEKITNKNNTFKLYTIGKNKNLLLWALQFVLILFSAKDWADPINSPQIPVRAVATGQRSNEDGATVNFLHYYDYFNFQTTITDPTVFEVSFCKKIVDSLNSYSMS